MKKLQTTCFIVSRPQQNSGKKLRIADFMPPDNKLLAGCREKNCPYTSKTNTGSSVRDFGFS